SSYWGRKCCLRGVALANQNGHASQPIKAPPGAQRVEPSTPRRGPAPTNVAFCCVLNGPSAAPVVATVPLAVSLARRSATRRPIFHSALELPKPKSRQSGPRHLGAKAGAENQ